MPFPHQQFFDALRVLPALDNTEPTASEIQFRVPAVPIAQPRQRTRVITKNGRAFAANYTPQKSPVNVFKATVQLAFQSAYDGPPLDGPVRAEIVFYLRRPKSMCWKTRPTPDVPCAKRPDIDNLVKSVADALTGLAWRDDAQISRLVAAKRICSGDGTPHVVVTISEDRVTGASE